MKQVKVLRMHKFINIILLINMDDTYIPLL